eukprot:tig00000189_g14348.t1
MVQLRARASGSDADAKKKRRKDEVIADLVGEESEQEDAEESDAEEDYTPKAAGKKKAGRAEGTPASGSAKQKAGKRTSKSPGAEDGDEESPAKVPDADAPAKKKGKTAGEGKKKAGAAGKQGSRHAVENLSLHEIILNHSDSIGMAAEEWRKRFSEDNVAQSVADLVVLIAQASGCPGDVSAEAVSNNRIDETIQELAESFPEDADLGFFSMNTKEGKQYVRNYLDFWDKVVAQAYNFDLFEKGGFMELLLRWVTQLACSAVNPFRHTATAVGCRVADGIIAAAEETKDRADEAERRLKAEEKKAKKNKEAIKSSKDLLDSSREALKALEDHLNNIFTGIFVHRYRDQIPAVRALAIRALGGWIIHYPDYFAQDKYVKYLGWTMSDKSPEVRKATLAALTELYKVESVSARFAVFTARFAPRMVETVRDTDRAVAADAIRLCQEVLRLETGALDRTGKLSPEDILEIYAFALDDDKAPRDAAAEFLATHVTKYHVPSLKAGGGKQKSSDEALQIRRLLEFLRTARITQAAVARFVQALWRHLPVARDMGAMTDLLLAEAVGSVKGANGAGGEEGEGEGEGGEEEEEEEATQDENRRKARSEFEGARAPRRPKLGGTGRDP